MSIVLMAVGAYAQEEESASLGYYDGGIFFDLIPDDSSVYRYV